MAGAAELHLYGQAAVQCMQQKKGFLRAQETREGMLAWLARALEINRERNKLQMNPRLAGTHSFFASLDAVLLSLCDPFLEPLSGKAWGKLDPG